MIILSTYASSFQNQIQTKQSIVFVVALVERLSFASTVKKTKLVFAGSALMFVEIWGTIACFSRVQMFCWVLLVCRIWFVQPWSFHWPTIVWHSWASSTDVCFIFTVLKLQSYICDSFPFRCSFYRNKYSILDANDNEHLRIVSPFCIFQGVFCCCCENKFTVTMIEEENPR